LTTFIDNSSVDGDRDRFPAADQSLVLLEMDPSDSQSWINSQSSMSYLSQDLRDAERAAGSMIDKEESLQRLLNDLGESQSNMDSQGSLVIPSQDLRDAQVAADRLLEGDSSLQRLLDELGEEVGG